MICALASKYGIGYKDPLVCVNLVINGDVVSYLKQMMQYRPPDEQR